MNGKKHFYCNIRIPMPICHIRPFIGECCVLLLRCNSVRCFFLFLFCMYWIIIKQRNECEREETQIEDSLLKIYISKNRLHYCCESNCIFWFDSLTAHYSLSFISVCKRFLPYKEKYRIENIYSLSYRSME